MNKRFAIAWVVLFIVWMAGDFLVHGVLLDDEYRKLPNLFRSEAEAGPYFPYMLLAHGTMAGAFAWIYSRGVEPAPWVGQGVRFGIAVALLTAVPTYMIYYVVQPMPPSVVIKQIVFASALAVILGLVAAFLYRDGKRTTSTSSGQT
jgi:hypothetical protein